MLLREINIGEKCIVKAVRAQGELGRRIRDLGIIPGTLIKMMAEAPLFDPVAIKVRDSVISLRNSEADFIEVERERSHEA